jgi:hypothetical protein
MDKKTIIINVMVKPDAVDVAFEVQGFTSTLEVLGSLELFKAHYLRAIINPSEAINISADTHVPN